MSGEFPCDGGGNGPALRSAPRRTSLKFGSRLTPICGQPPSRPIIESVKMAGGCASAERDFRSLMRRPLDDALHQWTNRFQQLTA